MLLPHALYVTVILLLSAVAAGFLVYILLKAIPRSSSSVSGSARGCGGIFGFMFLFAACTLCLTYVIPSSNIVFAGPDKEYSEKTAIFFKPASLIEEYGVPDFELGRNYIVNTTDRNMMIYTVKYGNIPVFSNQQNPVIEIPAGKCTLIEYGHMPDYYFYEPTGITVGKNDNKIQERYILDYMPTNP